MRRFKKQSLTNLVKGKRSFDPIHVNSVDFKYSEPITLHDFTTKHKVRILALKTNEELYYSAVEKDFRGVIEGIWALNSERIEKIDYIVGVLKGTIYAVYKYIKGSYRKLDDSWTQDEWDYWNSVHITMGKPDHYLNGEEDGDITKMRNKNKGVMQMIPVKVPESQKVIIGKSITDKDLSIGNKLINRTIEDKSFTDSRQGGRFYFD